LFQETRQISVKAAGGNVDKVLVIIADVTKVEDTKRIVDETIKKFGQLDVLVCFFGTSHIPKNFHIACNIQQLIILYFRKEIVHLQVNNAGGLTMTGYQDSHFMQPLEVFDYVINLNARRYVASFNEHLFLFEHDIRPQCTRNFV
jgi:NAD(P)-dependent dehydrogenase (short-subunit alcohol dehydrogenase family)